MSKLCVTCENSIDDLTNKMFSKDDDEIPDWFKEIGNYSLLPPPLNRNPNYNFYINKPDTSYPKNFNLTIKANVSAILPKITNTYVFFWASKKRDYLKTQYPQPAKAYGDFSNCGVAKIDRKGNIKFRFINPVPYQYQGIKYPPHLHFIYLEKNHLWNDRCNTIIVTPNLKLKQFKKLVSSNKYLVLCALPKRFGFPMVKNTKRLSFETSPNLIDQKIKSFITPKLLACHSNIKNIPIITYCKNKDCDAGEKLVEKLRNLEYININYI